MGGWRNSPGLSPHCWLLQGAWLEHGIARLVGTEECEYRCPGWAWTASGCPKPIRTLPSLAMPHKVGALQCPCPIHPAVLAAQWCGPLGRDCGGSVQDVSFPHEHQQLGMWDSRLWVPLALLCSFPCYQNGRWRLCSCREGGRKVQLLWGRSNPHLPNPGAQSRVGQSSGAGACTGPENNLHIRLQLLCPLDLPT